MVLSHSALYEYFAIIGYNPAFGLKQERISLFGDASVPMPKSPLEATYEAKVIAHYPAERIGRPFAPEIASLALPLGVQLFTEQNVPRDPSFHSFVLVREDGSRLHGCSLIFYEELQSAELKKQIFDAQLGYYRDFASAFPVSASTSSESSSPDWQQQQPHQQHARKFTTHSLPRKLSGNKRAGGAISLANASLNKEEETAIHASYYKSPNSPLYISKCMAIPAIYSSENLLHFIWLLINDKYSSSVDGGPALDDVLCWVLNEIPLPPPGTSVHMTQSPHFKISIKNPAAGELPFFDYPIETLFSYVPVDKFLKLLTSFMLEKHILIFSKNARTLMLIAECISALIFPFTWQMTYCPILPHSQLGFLAAPWSWLMGICLEDDNISEHFSQSDICFLNVDANRLEIPEDLPSFPRAQQFSGQLNALLKEFKENVKPKGDGIHGFYLRGLQFNAAIRSLFLGHFASLFSSYSAYLLTTGGSENTLERRARNGRRRAPIVRESTANFDKISFLVDQPESVLPFLSAFLETQMFTSFIDSKILSSQNPLQSEAVHIFDQKIVILQPENLPLNFANSLDLNFDFLSKASPSPSKTALEFRISPPPSRNPCPLYHGILPLLDPKLFEFHQEQTHSNHGWAEKTTMIQNEQTDENVHNKRKLLIMSTEQNADENDGEGGGQLVKHKDGNDHRETATTNAPMNLASQNWKFVEQLLKETKAKTKRILVAKMGKEAIHLGHGQLHMGISGVEENTLVAAFCDLLERIWSHGLKKKQGKSALWAYIIAYHEWEKKNSRTTSRRSSSVSVVDSSSPGSGLDNCDDDSGNNNSPKALVELISSIRRIAGTLEMPRSRDNSPPQVDSNSGGSSSSNLASNNWSQSLLRAANVICEKITANTATMNKEEPLEERPSSTKCQQFIGKNKHGLPPRPPLPQPNHQAERSQNQPQQRRLFTPQLRRRNVADVTTPRARASTPTKFAEEKVQHQQSDERREEATYRKFIYQGPLKAVNNQQQQHQQKTTERRSREATVKKQPRSASSQPNGRDLASHLSEDSLSKMAISTVGGGGTPKRRTRDLSSGPAQCQYAAPTVVDRQQSRNRSLSRSNSPSRLYERFTRGIRAVGGQQELRTLSPLPNTMAYDLKNIIRMTEIKTDIGYARAFIRLALERKLLYQYLKKLLSNTQVLQKLYKRNAFLRGDDEREQFLFHMLSLNAVDFFCFTNSFLTIKMRYQVMFVGSLDRFPASMFYVVLTGSLGCTSHIYLPANSTQFSFDFKNLGILSTLRVAAKEQADQKVSKWYLDYVLVRNCVTAQIFYFRCGRWFGRGIDDGALERLLVAEAIVSRPSDEDSAESANGSGSSTDFLLRRPESPLVSAAAFLSPRKAKYAVPSSTASVVSSQEGAAGNGRRTRWRSPSTDRRKMSTDSMAQYSSGKSDVGIASTALDHLQALEHKVGVAVNALMKHFLITTERDHQNSSAKLSTLLCADEGLLPCIDEIFSHGLVQRIFQRIYPWDYVDKVFSLFSHYFRTGESKKFTPEQRSLIIYAYKVVDKISGHNVVGKDGKFHLFVLLCLRDHIFPGLLMLMTWTPATSQMYDQSAFLRQPAKLSYLAKLIGSLNEFQFDYDKSLMHGITF